MAITNGTNLNSVASAQRHTLAGNYLDLSSSGWAQQYLPDLMEKEAEVFGNRTISGFLAQVGAEEAMAADQVVWSEQGRLHISCIGTIVVATGIVTIVSDIDGNLLADGYGSSALADNHGFREGDTVIVAGAAGTAKCRVTDTSTTVGAFEVEAYNSTATNALLSDAGIVNAETVTVMVYGSDFGKGTKGYGSHTTATIGGTKSIDPTFKSFTNKPIILKDLYEVSGSDASAIGWVEVSGEEGQNGYLWYLKAAGDQKHVLQITAKCL